MYMSKLEIKAIIDKYVRAKHALAIAVLIFIICLFTLVKQKQINKMKKEIF